MLVELAKTLRAEWARPNEKRFVTIAEAQVSLDAWVEEYNTRRRLSRWRWWRSTSEASGRAGRGRHGAAHREAH